MNLFDVYSVFPINIVRGKGCYVYDEKGKSYLDFYGGHAVISIGHSHPYLIKCMYEQMQNLMFYSNSVINKLQEKLAYEIGNISIYPEYSAFFVNSGAEANENALKLASFHTGKKKVIAFKNAFHGRTSAAVEATDNPLITAPLNSNDNVYFSNMDINEVKNVLQNGDICAVIIEGISGVGGIRIPKADFLIELRNITQQYGTILILDEIQSGYGRTGRFFAHQWCSIKPDIITIAKGIANGFPFSGVLISDIFTPKKGMLGTTFGGNQLGCAAALAVIQIMKDENLIENANNTGTYFIQQLQFLKSPLINEIRGRGLMIGIEFTIPISKIRESLLFEHHIFTGYSGTNILRILPPLCVTKQQIDYFIERLAYCLDNYQQERASSARASAASR